ncbi:MAG: TetR/AcrR family transcriptional regulator [Cyanobacteria bacterium SZAS TMP-1]|nr:TetR/AcrR family transcriptional regulator [Cyanobacteria bacterium SZAS TMP-1]
MTKLKKDCKTRDAEATKASILDAAEREFARAGLLGARTENIAEDTGVTRAMIHYYYESKEKLYQAVLDRSFQRRIRNIAKVDLINAPVDEALQNYVRAFMEESIDNVNICSILLLESIQNHGKYYKEMAMVAIYEPLVKLFERGMAEGSVRKLDPYQTAINTVGMCIFYVLARNNLTHLFPPGTDLMSRDMVQVHIDEAIEMLKNGVLS